MILYKSALPRPEGELRQKLAEYRRQLSAHAVTEGEPAPWPEFDIFFEIVSRGGDFEVVDDTPPEREASPVDPIDMGPPPAPGVVLTDEMKYPPAPPMNIAPPLDLQTPPPVEQ